MGTKMTNHIMLSIVDMIDIGNKYVITTKALKLGARRGVIKQ